MKIPTATAVNVSSDGRQGERAKEGDEIIFSASTKEEAVELATKEYRAETGDIVLRVEEVDAKGEVVVPPKKKKRAKTKR